MPHKDEIDDAENTDDAGIKPPRENRPVMSHDDVPDADEFDDVRRSPLDAVTRDHDGRDPPEGASV